MKKAVIVISIILLAVSTFIPQVSCGRDSGETEPIPSESNRWLQLLKVLPENEDTLKAAYLTDGEYMLEKMPTGEYAVGHRMPLFGSSPSGYNDEEWKATLGFVSDDVQQSIYAGAIPTDIYQAVRGDFNKDDIDNAAKTGPGNEDVEILSHSGYEFYSWGEDRAINLSRRSNIRPLGRGHRLALVDNFVFWMIWTEGLTNMIDAYADNIPSLADNEDYKLLAGALEELDTVNAFFSAESHSLAHYYEVIPREKLEEELDPEIKDRLFSQLDYEYPLKAYNALATGAGKNEKGYYLAIALVNEDEATAKQNADLLEKRINNLNIVWPANEGESWKNLIDSMEIDNKGRLTMAKLYGDVVVYWDSFEILGGMPYEPLLVHE